MDNHLTVNIVSARNAIIMYHHKVFFLLYMEDGKKGFSGNYFKENKPINTYETASFDL